MNNVKEIHDSINTTYYLNRYTDLKNAFGNNDKKAKKHFLNNGVYEKRYFNLPYEQVLTGIASSKSSDGNIYPYTNEYIKFPNMTTDEDVTTVIEKTKNLNNADECIKKCNENSNCGGINYKENTNGTNECTIWNTNVYPDSDIKKSQNTDFYMRLRELRKFCDAECMKNKNLNDLEKKFDNIYNEITVLPEKIQDVTKKLMVGAEGEVFYNEFMKQQYQETSDKTINKVKTSYSKIYNFRMELIENYKKKLDYQTLLSNNNIDEEIKNLKQKIIEKTNTKNVDARKSYYEKQENNNLDYYLDYVIFFYFSLFIVYVYVFIKNEKYTDRKQIILPVIFFIAPYILYFYVFYYLNLAYDYFIKKIPKNVYLTKQE